MAKCIIDVIEEIGPSKVTGLCTDNAANMKRAWNGVKDTYPHIHAYGCLAHMLNLTFGDILKMKSVDATLKNSTGTSVVKTVSEVA